MARALEDRFEGLAHISFERGNLAGFGRVGFKEALGQPDHAQLQAFLPPDFVAFALHNLDTAAADIDDQRALAAEVDRMARGGEYHPRFLGAGDHVDMQAELFPRLQHELAAVDRFAHRAGRYRQDRIGALTLGQALESAQRLEPEGHRFGRQPSAGQGPAGQPDHFLGAIQDFEIAVPHLRGDHVNRIGADVDGRDPHCRSRRARFHWLRAPSR